MFETTSLQREILILVLDSWNSVKWCMNYSERKETGRWYKLSPFTWLEAYHLWVTWWHPGQNKLV
jgi:hypothetical protein